MFAWGEWMGRIACVCASKDGIIKHGDDGVPKDSFLLGSSHLGPSSFPVPVKDARSHYEKTSTALFLKKVSSLVSFLLNFSGFPIITLRRPLRPENMTRPIFSWDRTVYTTAKKRPNMEKKEEE